MKIILGLDEHKLGTVETTSAGKFAFVSFDPAADTAVLRNATETAAHQLASHESTPPERIEKLTAADVLKWMLERMHARHFWAEPADKEAAAACGRPLNWEKAHG